MPQEKSCGAVIFRKDSEIKYLLLHYGAGHWDFVKGNVEPNESETETAIREISEETGINDVRFIDGFRERISYYYRRGKNLIFKEVIFYLAQTQENTVKLSYEHVGYEWLTYEKAMERLTFANPRRVLQKANELLRNMNQA